MSKAPFDVQAATRTLARRDPGFSALVRHIGPCQLQRQPMQSTFSALAHTIVYQQLSGAAAATIYARLKQSLGQMTAERVINSNQQQLRGAGLSRAKTLAIQDLAQRTVRRQLPGRRALLSMSDEAVVEALTQVRGIGPWSAEMVLIFRLGRPDVFPATDLGVRKGYAAAFAMDHLPEPDELARLGQRWAPYRSVASWYLWRAADNPPGAIPPATQ